MSKFLKNFKKIYKIKNMLSMKQIPSSIYLKKLREGFFNWFFTGLILEFKEFL